jgi:release factor glutamine methyltransferase
MEQASTWTIGSLLTWAASDFRERGMESPRLEAEILLAHVLGADRIRLIVESGRPLSTGELNAYKALFKRRRSGEPTAYILGQREFFGRSFEVNPHVLIPRPDTEILVQVALKRTSHRKLTGRALDLCTGSGCVAVSFALERRTWQVTASDVSEHALEVARKNALKLGAIWGLRFVVSDLFSALDQGERYELVTANPPYIPIGEHKGLDPTVKDFEPALALVGGEDGLDLYPRLIRQARQHLVPGGVLAVEVGAGQAAAVEQIFMQEGFSALSREKDYGGHERVVSGKASSPGRAHPG